MEKEMRNSSRSCYLTNLDMDQFIIKAFVSRGQICQSGRFDKGTNKDIDVNPQYMAGQQASIFITEQIM